MLTNGYQYVLTLYRQKDRERLGAVVAAVDWDPAVQCTRFSAIRRGDLSPVEQGGAVSIEPTWDAKAGKPCAGGFRVTISENGEDAVSREFPITYFSEAARVASAEYVEKGQLERGDLFYYIVMALPRKEEAPRPRGPLALKVKEVSPALRLKETALSEFSRIAAPFEETTEEDMPVFIPQPVVDETIDLAKKAGADETGGILIGHLHRDRQSPEVFLEVTAQIPARHTEAQITKLTFTKETWAAVEAAVALRNRGEMYLGWWHSHSFFQETCKDCEKQKDNSCNVDALFFSPDDCALHRSVFSRAWGIGLLISNAPCSGIKKALFGWRNATITRRGFHILGAAEPAVRTGAGPAETATIGGDDHAATQ